eukprot:m.10055 g.10055  ORF g.10055 m.10055 type:complete len:185 (-) comp3598_c0_seq2:884-1438(-)
MSVEEDGFTFKLLTLVFVFTEGRKKILLGMKKRGFGKDRFNGFGGKLEKGETIEQAAIRELEEESHLTASKLEKMGRIFFEFVGDKTILEVHVFEATEWIGEPEETEEMDPKWFCVDNLPFESMWLDDKHWFPFLLSQQAFSGYFLFDGEYAIVKKILKGNDVDETFDTLRKEVDSEENQQSSS